MVITIVFAINLAIRPNMVEALMAGLAAELPTLVGLAGGLNGTGFVTCDADSLAATLDVLDGFAAGGNILVTATRLGEGASFTPVVHI